ncbi:hypothetical protein [Oceaniglobus roseus]|uniref:hypothetical protein n=1 Tax=Oceaniglobus roseus TaxID=1737570 RepID=UPI000C7F22E2|nr:hypothetical protein [Kandeliimicrobium roseum]
MTPPPIGHNNGPTLEPGARWRKHCWAEARSALLPQLPLNVIRRRVARARALGLDYRTYATVRASTGQDIIGFLFSSNALRLARAGHRLPRDRAGHLAALERCSRIALMLPPHACAVLEGEPLDDAHAAPAPMALFRDQRAAVLAALAPGKIPSDRMVLVGDAPFEKEWVAAGRLAAYLPADRVFSPAGGAQPL